MTERRQSNHMLASPSERRNKEGADDKKIRNNNQEEEEEDGNDYDTEDFDDQSKEASRKIPDAEGDDYPNDYGDADGDDRSALKSLATDSVTEGDSASQESNLIPQAGGPVTRTIATRQEVKAVRAAEMDNSVESYDDDFADDDSIGAPPQPEAPIGYDGAYSTNKHHTEDQHWENELATAAPGSYHPPPDQSFNGKPTGDSDSYGSDGDWVGSDHGVGNDGDGTAEDGLSAAQMSEGAKVPRDTDDIRVTDDDAALDRKLGEITTSFDSSLVADPPDKDQVPMGENTRRGVTEEKMAADWGGCDTDKELEMLRKQVGAARAVITSSLDDDDDNQEKSLLELVLLAESRSYKNRAEKNEIITGVATTTELSTRKSSTATAAAAAAAAASLKVESTARAELEKRVESLERDLARVGQESRMQSGRAASLQGRLDAVEAGNDDVGGSLTVIVDDNDNGPEAVATGDILVLKRKVAQLIERFRKEKYARLKWEREAQKTTRKVQMLSDHIEKLMVFLKHEATQRAKAHEQQRRLQKELGLVKARNSALMRSNQAKDRATIELREGSKILEDQLRLMDEKYMELRTKLDWTRTKAEKDVRKARAQASALRSKWALLSGDGKMGGCPLLDSVKIDVGAPLRQSASVPGETSKGWREGISEGEHGFNAAGRKTKQQQQQEQYQPPQPQHQDYQLEFHGVPSRGRDASDSSPITDGRYRPETALSGRFKSGRMETVGTGSRRGQGMTPSMSALSLLLKHGKPHGQQRHTAASGGLGRAGAGGQAKERGYTQQQPRAVSCSPRVGGNYPNTRAAAGSPGASFPKGSEVSFDPGMSTRVDPAGGIRGGFSVNSRVGGGKSSGGGVSMSGSGRRLPLGEGGRDRGGDGGRGALKLLYA